MSSANTLVNKIVEICKSFDTKTFSLPKTKEEFKDKIEERKGDVRNSENIRKETIGEIKKLLKGLSSLNEETGFSDFDTLRIKLLREKLIYTNLNKLIAKENIFYGRAWIPA